MRKPALAKKLEMSAAKAFRTTRSIPFRFDYQFQQMELMSQVYGDAAIIEDFEAWASTVKNVKYPLSEYLKVVDSRLGNAEDRKDNPDVTKIMAVVYQYIKDFPRKVSVEKLLEKYGFENLQEAWLEYADGLSEDELKYAIKKFFEDGGVDVVYADMTKFQKEKA